MSKLFTAAAILCLAFSPAWAQKGPDPPTGSPQAPTTTGGPDAFGYVFFDQAEPECPFQYIDIAGTGAAQNHADDQNTTVVLGGPAFDFYATSYTQVAFDSNGYLQLGTPTPADFTNDCPVPNTTDPDNLIAPYWDDFNPAEANADDDYFQYFANCPRPSRFPGVPGCNVFQWRTCFFGSSCGGVQQDLEVILYDTWDIVYQYQQTTQTGTSASIGIENSDASIGLGYSCNTGGAVGPGSAVCFFHPNPVPVALEDFSAE